MNCRKFFVRLKRSFIWASVVATEQTAVNIYIPGVYRREWKDAECGNVEVLTIKLRESVTDIYELTFVQSRLIPHNERMVYNTQPQIFLAAFNAGTKQLFEIGGLRVFSFLLEENLLLINKQAYVKTSGETF